MKNTKVFRTCLMIQLLSVILKIVTDFHILTEFHEAWVIILLFLKEIVVLMVVLPLLILYLMSWLGMFFCWRPARIVFTVTFFIETMMYPVLSADISQSTLADIFGGVSAMAGGIVIAMANFSDIKGVFEKGTSKESQV